MQIPLPKLKAITLYFCEHTDKLGMTKLMKLFYFLDFGNLKKHAIPVTYDSYMKWEHGPVPCTIHHLVDSLRHGEGDLELSDVIKIEPKQTAKGEMLEISPLRKFTSDDSDYLSPQELATLEAVCKKYGKMTKDEIEKASHAESPWKMSQMLQTIPYIYASFDDDCEVTAEEIALSQI